MSSAKTSTPAPAVVQEPVAVPVVAAPTAIAGSGWAWSFRYEGAANGLQAAVDNHSVPSDAAAQFKIACTVILAETMNTKSNLLVIARGDSGLDGGGQNLYIEVVAR